MCDSAPPESRDPVAPAGAGWSAARASLLSAWAERQPLVLTVKDADSGRYIAADAAFGAWVGREVAELLGRVDAELFGADVALALRAADVAALAAGPGVVTGAEHRFDLLGQRREFAVLRRVQEDAGGSRWLAAAWTDLAPQRQKDAQLRLALEQLEQQQQAYAALRAELQGRPTAVHPAGSELYDAAHFEDLLRREADLSQREHREFALVAIELDPLPAEVAQLGGPALSALQAALGRLLRGNTRAMDAACQLGDMRFALLLSGVGLATAHARMEGLRRQCATQIVMLEGRELGFTVSMGVASFPHTAQTLPALRAASDEALLQARGRGGNHVALAGIRLAPS
jgi:diguanylate cyclase (GGDEF)-like protein